MSRSSSCTGGGPSGAPCSHRTVRTARHCDSGGHVSHVFGQPRLNPVDVAGRRPVGLLLLRLLLRLLLLLLGAVGRRCHPPSTHRDERLEPTVPHAQPHLVRGCYCWARACFFFGSACFCTHHAVGLHQLVADIGRGIVRRARRPAEQQRRPADLLRCCGGRHLWK